MEAPDKIYLREFKEGGLSQVWSGIKPTEETIIALPEYIRKDALLEYLRKEYALVDFHLKAKDDPVWWGQRNAFQQVIDKLNSM